VCQANPRHLGDPSARDNISGARACHPPCIGRDGREQIAPNKVGCIRQSSTTSRFGSCDAGSDMKLDLMVMAAPLRTIQQLARDASQAGFDGLVVTESGRTAYLSCAAAALASDLDLATGIAVAFPRSPMVTASVAWELAEATSGHEPAQNRRIWSRNEVGLTTFLDALNRRSVTPQWPMAISDCQAPRCLWLASGARKHPAGCISIRPRNLLTWAGPVGTFSTVA
jgi:hypothetical protein